ncbi:glycyl-tRNA synthetase beta chain [Enterobacter sp. CC120223-11]|nr:glycyl-tRNA synthetase beta chain [Enterobacter sp. CC120223-11]
MALTYLSSICHRQRSEGLRCYQKVLVELASLREPVDEFFENVMVNAEDKDVRINRLTLLTKLRELFLQVADISLLQ